MLLTLATGTGKTFVAMQIVWKLWNSELPWGGSLVFSIWPTATYSSISRSLESSALSSVTRYGRSLAAGGPGREIVSLLPSACRGSDTAGIFRDYPADYFDLIIVDECHRGSARDESSWRSTSWAGPRCSARAFGSPPGPGRVSLAGKGVIGTVHLTNRVGRSKPVRPTPGRLQTGCTPTRTRFRSRIARCCSTGCRITAANDLPVPRSSVRRSRAVS